MTAHIETAADHLARVLARHDLFGPEGIPADGEYAWLRCPCGWSLTYEMPEDDMALVNAKAMEHLAEVAVGVLWGAGADESVRADALRQMARDFADVSMSKAAVLCIEKAIATETGAA